MYLIKHGQVHASKFVDKHHVIIGIGYVYTNI